MHGGTVCVTIHYRRVSPKIQQGNLVNFNLSDFILNLSKLVGENLWLAPLIALAAGLLTSLTPCSLSTIPLVLGCVGGLNEHEPKKAFRLSLMFALGSMITFTVLGFAASLLGNLLNSLGVWLHLALALLLIAMALQMFGVFEIIPETSIKAKPNKGYWATFTAGLLAGAFSSHCTTPVLIAMLAIVANNAHILYGVLLLVIFSIGHGVLSVIAGTSAGFVSRLMSSPRYMKAEKIVRIILGVVILLAAAYLLCEVIGEAFFHAEHVH